MKEVNASINNMDQSGKEVFDNLNSLIKLSEKVSG